MAKPKKKQLTPAEKLLAGKRRLIARLEGDIRNLRSQTENEIANIQTRINIARSIIDAPEKGTLKL